MPEANRRLFLLALLLAALAIVVYLPALGNGFVDFDDPLYVTANPQVQRGLTPGAVLWALGANVASNWHPLTMVSHMADYGLYGLEPWGHHLTSVLLHAANAALVCIFLFAATGALGRSAVVAALFAVHPLRVESVAWVAERKDVLSTFFGLLALLAYVAWARRGGRGRYLLVAAALAAGLMSKAMLVTWPFLFLLLDVWPLDRLPPPPVARGRAPAALWASFSHAEGRRALVTRVVEKLPFFALSALAALVAIFTQGGAIEQVAARPLGARLANAAVSYVRYLELTFWPRDLAIFYPFPESLPAGQVAGAVVLLAVLTAGALALLRRAPYLAVGWLWFLGTLVPVIGIVSVGGQALADRYAYVPTIGVYLALVWVVAELLTRMSARAPEPATPLRRHRALVVAVGLTLATVVPLAVQTHAQIAHWRDSETLFRHALAVTRGNYLAHVNLAETLRRRGEGDEGLEHYRAAVALRPELASTHAALGGALHAWNRPDEALPHLERAAALGSRDPRVHHVLGLVYETQGRGDDAFVALRRSVELDPRFVPGHRDLALRLDRRGDGDGAIHHYREAVRHAPDPVLHGRLGVLLGQRGELPEAASHLREAVRLAPDDPAHRFNLGVTLARLGDLPAAVRELEKARSLAPDDPAIARALEAARAESSK